MDFRQIATEVTVFMTPFFPYLMLGAEGVAKEIGEKFGESAWDKAKSLWDRIRNITNSDPKLNSATIGLAEDPNDNDYRLIFAKSLAKQLEKSPELANDLIDLMKNDESIQRILVEQGGKVKDIYQRLSLPGKQEAIIRGSEAGNITQEQ